MEAELRLKKRLKAAIAGAEEVEFRELLLQSMKSLKLLDKDIALEFDMSRPSVNRWKNGRTVPHPTIRKIVYRYLEQLTIMK